MTFYPDSASKDQATPVELVAGQNLTGVDIRLARRRSVAISGNVRGIPERGTLNSFTTVLLFSWENTDSFHMNRELPVEPNGKFTIPGLTPGRYLVQARLHAPEDANLQSRAVEVHADSGDETGIALELARGEPVSGTVEFEGEAVNAPAKPSAEKLTVRLEPGRGMADSGGSNSAEVSESGAFQVPQVFPGKFRVRVMPMPENAYIKSVKLGGYEAPDGMVDLSDGVTGAGMQVTLSRNGGQFEGSVVDDDGKPLQGNLALVLLAATADDIGQQNFKPVEPGQKFRYTGLRPGKYRLIAIDVRQFSGGFERLRGLFPNAPEIEIHEGDRIVKDVKLMDAGSTARENQGANR
jgi:hypothetical protein